MPQNPLKVATKSCHSEVNLFDMGLDSSGGVEVVLKGHDTEGYGLSWNRLKEGFLLSGSYDFKICLWDLGAANGEKVLDAHQVFEVMSQRYTGPYYNCLIGASINAKIS